MSYLGAPPAPPYEAPPSGEPSSDIPLWAVGVAAFVALALAGTLAFVLLRPDHSAPNAAPPPPATSYPAHWDRRIAPYAKIAAHERGLSFLHPVPVRFLSPTKFAKTLTTDEKHLSRNDRRQLEQATGQLRALGLIAGDVNLLEANNDAQAGAVDAYYSFKDKRITVRGHHVTPAVKATLVHELTHVLQDQHFRVGARLKKLGKESEKGPDTSQASVLDAIVEGDAQRVAHLYAASLGPRQRRALAASQRAEVSEADRRTAEVPHVVMAMMGAPYDLGEGLVQTVAQEGGNAAVDRLFRHPPTHESALLDPFRVLTRSTSAAKVALPTLQAREKRFEYGELGVLTWYVTLAQRLPLPQALAAADGWGGDAYVGYQHDGTTCIRAAYTGRTPADSTRMYTALQGWRAAAPGAGALVSRSGDVVRLPVLRPAGRGGCRPRRRAGRHRPGSHPDRHRGRPPALGAPEGRGALHGRSDGGDLHRGPAEGSDLRTGRLHPGAAPPVRRGVRLTSSRAPWAQSMGRSSSA